MRPLAGLGREYGTGWVVPPRGEQGRCQSRARDDSHDDNGEVRAATGTVFAGAQYARRRVP